MRVKMILAGIGLAVLAACGDSTDVVYATDEVVRAKAYREPGPATITLITMVSNRSGAGSHSALMINASQRVIFDPAGSFVNDRVPEQEDVLYGVTPAVFQGYRSAHARSTFHVVTQTIEVSPEQAEIALRLAQQHGVTQRSFCTQATSGLLQQVPGFETTQRTFFPQNLRRQFAGYPGVVTEEYFEDDDGTVHDGIAGIVIPN